MQLHLGHGRHASPVAFEVSTTGRDLFQHRDHRTLAGRSVEGDPDRHRDQRRGRGRGGPRSQMPEHRSLRSRWGQVVDGIPFPADASGFGQLHHAAVQPHMGRQQRPGVVRFAQRFDQLLLSGFVQITVQIKLDPFFQMFVAVGHVPCLPAASSFRTQSCRERRDRLIARCTAAAVRPTASAMHANEWRCS